METLILNNATSQNLELLLETAKKLGLDLRVKEKESKETMLRKLAKRLDESVVPNDISMDEIVEEVRLVREERQKYADENNS